MKFAMLTLAVVMACAAVAVEAGIDTKSGYLYQHRERLGHFKEQPFIDLYKMYAAAFVLPLHKDHSHDDFRSFTPSVDECVLFFRSYRANKYQLKQIEHFIVLDACLGYLYESKYQEMDKEESRLAKDNLQALIDDPNLQQFYQGSKLNEMPEPAKHCVADLMMSSVLMRRQFSQEQCNNKWIQLFLQFANCHQEIPESMRSDDTYIKTLYQVVREETHKCFDAEIHYLNEAVRKHYKHSYGTRFGNKLMATLGSSIDKQQDQRMWPSNILRLLKVVQGAKNEVSLRQVHELLRGFYLGDETLTKIFLDNIATYASKVIKPNSRDAKGDPTGEERYRDDVVNNLCNYFRSSDNEKRWDFSSSFVRMVQLLEHQDVFAIDFKTFINNILTHAYETASLYLSISACNILTHTQGHVDLPAGNGKIGFVVEPRPDMSDMVRWPDAGHY